jgi:hypothetical protein
MGQPYFLLLLLGEKWHFWCEFFFVDGKVKSLIYRVMINLGCSILHSLCKSVV